MDDLIKKFYKISPRLRQRIYDLIHGENNISQLDNKLILNNESEPMDESEFNQVHEIISKFFTDDEWILIHCNLDFVHRNSHVFDFQYRRIYGHVTKNLNWNFIPYNETTVKNLKCDKEKIFLFYNGSLGDRASHRIMSFHFLLDYGILDKIMYSILQSPTELSYDYLDSIESKFNTKIDWRKYDSFFQKSPYFLDVELGKHEFVDLKNQYQVLPANSLDLPLNHIEKTYFSLVTESFFFEPHWCDDKSLFDISEKTYKAILTQPFIIMGRPYLLKYLRDKGFDTFDDVFDNSYDEIENDWDRFQTIMKEVKRICDLQQETLHELYLSCVDRVISNQQKFLSYEGKI